MKRVNRQSMIALIATSLLHTGVARADIFTQIHDEVLGIPTKINGIMNGYPTISHMFDAYVPVIADKVLITKLPDANHPNQTLSFALWQTWSIVEEIQTDLETVTSTVNTLPTNVLSTKLPDANYPNQTLSFALWTTWEIVEDIQTHLETVESAVNSVQSTVNSLPSPTDILSIKLPDANHPNQSLSFALWTTWSIVEDIQDEIPKIQQIPGMVTKVNDLATDLADVSSDVTTVIDDIALVATGVGTLKTAVDGLALDIPDLLTEVGNAATAATNAATSVGELVTDVDNLQSTVGGVKSATDRIPGLVEQVADLTGNGGQLALALEALGRVETVVADPNLSTAFGIIADDGGQFIADVQDVADSTAGLALLISNVNGIAAKLPVGMGDDIEGALAACRT